MYLTFVVAIKIKYSQLKSTKIWGRKENMCTLKYYSMLNSYSSQIREKIE